MAQEQLTLRFGWGDRFSFSNFHAGDNQPLLDCLQQAARGEGEQFVFVWGAAGSGKSHLLQAACESAAAQGRSVAYLPLDELAALGPEMLSGLEHMSLLCIDELDRVLGDHAWEQALFHLYNSVRDNGGVLLVAATMAPAGLPVALVDLRSRLGWGPVFRLAELSDADKIAALQLRAGRRGFDLPTEVAEFLMRRSARDMPTLFGLLDRLDQASLAQQRKLTIPFVRQLL